MKTLTIKLPDELARRLERRARLRGQSKSTLARDALARELGDDSDESVEETKSAYGAMKDGLGCVETGASDLSTNPKHMEGFGL